MARTIAVHVGSLSTPAHIPNVPLDDPNPDFNGSIGRTPVSPHPIPAGYPTPWTTGPRGLGVDVASLTPHAGGVTYSTPGQVIEGIDFAERVILNAAGITLRNCQVTSADFYALSLNPTATGALIENVRVRGTGAGANPASAFLTEAADTTVRRSHFTGGYDSIKIGGANFLLEDSYVVAGYVSVPLDTHNDCVQSGGGTGITLRRNSIIGRWREQTSCCIIKADFGPISQVLMEANYFSGGNFCLYFTDVGANLVTDVTLTNNRFELDSWNPAGGAYLTIDNADGVAETGTLVLAS